MRSIGLALGVALTVTAIATAGPIDLKEVGADAKWVAHLDADAARASTVVQKVCDKWVERNPEARKTLTKVGTLLGFEPTKDVYSVTLYAPQIKQDTGVAVVHAKIDPRHLANLIEFVPDHQVHHRGTRDVYTWTSDWGTPHARPTAGAMFKPEVFVFARTAEEVDSALAVLDGKQPSLAGKDSPLAVAVAPGTVFLARAIGLSDINLPVKSRLSKEIRLLSVAVGESHGESFVAGKATMSSKETADKVKSLADGVRALIELQEDVDPIVAKLVKAAKVAVSDGALSVEWRGTAEEAWAAIQKAAELRHRGH
jgi:hypothetical protein